MKPSRAGVASSFTAIKGAMIAETYAGFAAWDLAQSKSENLTRLRNENLIGAKTSTWLRDVSKVLNRRFDPNGRDRPLVRLAQNSCDVEVWRPLLLWHMTRDEFLVRDFLVSWLFPRYDEGALRVRPEELEDYLRKIGDRGGATEHAWSLATLERVAGALLNLAVDFGLLRGGATKEFASYHLPDYSFLYLLHAMRETTATARRLIESPDWRMYLMRPHDVEVELLRLHQYRQLEYHVAGSIVELALPSAGLNEWVESKIA
jgi:Putative inner membrane protein (DUF1819)